MKELTRAEEQIMQVIWDLKKCFVKEVLEALPEPKPAYNTVSTIVRILEEKGFVTHESFGKSHRYFALIDKPTYRKFATGKLLKGYFGGKVENLLSYFAGEKDLTLDQLQEIINQAKENNQNQ